MEEHLEKGLRFPAISHFAWIFKIEQKQYEECCFHSLQPSPCVSVCSAAVFTHISLCLTYTVLDGEFSTSLHLSGKFQPHREP